MKSFLLTLLFVSSCSVMPVMAQEQNDCAPRNVIVKNLNDKYGEVNSSIAIVSDDNKNGVNVMEMFRNPKTKTFTIMITNLETNLSCIKMIGEQWIYSREIVGDPL